MNVKSQTGVTLLEIILVLAVASSVIVLSFMQYNSYENRANLAAIQFNVDQLFQAMQHFYQAECNGNYESTGGILVPGLLSPQNGLLSGGATTNPPTFPIVATQVTNNASDPQNSTQGLIGLGFLNASAWQPYNALISESGARNDSTSYVVQFNPTLTSGVTVNSCYSYPTSPETGFPLMRECQQNSSGSPLISQTANNKNIYVLNWASQVAVQVPATFSPTQALALKAALNADCVSVLSNLAGLPSVTPCQSSPALGTGPYYLVWQRTPSYTAPNSTTSYWQSLPNLKQFNLQYTHDQMLELQQTGTNTFYICGG